MIICTRYDNLYMYGHAFHAQFKLRHECFIERQDYDVSCYQGMEFDQYDTPAAIYLVYLGYDGTAWGCSRLTPINSGSMLRDLWPTFLAGNESYLNDRTWEGTRFCIKKNLPVDLRKRICNELVVAYLEVGLEMNIKNIIGVMPPYILRRVFSAAGCEYTHLGKQLRIKSGETILAASMEVNSESLERAKLATGIKSQIILNSDTNIKEDLLVYGISADTFSESRKHGT